MKELKLDNLDRLILRELQANADMTNEVLGQRVNTSSATCQRRVHRLKEAGVIERVVAIVNADAIGEPLLAIVEISLVSQTTQSLMAFESKVCASNWVQQCYRVSTGPDFVLVIAVPDMKTYHDFASALFTSSNEVRNVRTFFSVMRSKFGTNIPI